VTGHRQPPVALSIGALLRRAWPVIATSAALLAFSAAPASAQCGETTDVSPRVSAGPGPAPLAIGDSVLYDASQALASDGFHVNAMVCRTMAQGIVWLESHADNLPTVVVVALGTNGAVTVGQIDQLLSLLGPNRVLGLVTPHHGNYAYVPALFRAAARRFPGRIILLDFDQLSAGHPSWFAPDGIHLGSTAGVDAFARLVASALLTTPGQASTSTVTVPGPVTLQPPPTGPGPPAPAPPLAGHAMAVVRLAVSTFAAFRRWLFIL
jgi:hypothetical protein